jgi:hypothetical protein
MHWHVLDQRAHRYVAVACDQVPLDFVGRPLFRDTARPDMHSFCFRSLGPSLDTVGCKRRCADRKKTRFLVKVQTNEALAQFFARKH